MRTVFKKTLALIFCLTFAFSPVATTIPKAQASATGSAGDIITTALGCFGVFDKVASAITSLTDSVLSGGQDIPVKDSNANSKENCLDSIAYTAAKIVLAKITKSTLAWINSGFDGSPTFVQDPGSFFGSIANEQVSSFTAKIAFDPNRFPFGRITAQNIISSIQQKLDYNASVTSGYLLNNDNDPTIPYAQRFDAFTQDFLYGGGWNGYLAVTQITGANPFDSYIESVNHVGPSINNAINQKDPVQQISQELQQANGFLSLKKCVDPTYYTPESSDPSFTRADAEAISNDSSNPDWADANFWIDQHTCARFETQTPGTAIADQMKISLGTTKEQLALADELNESISAVFDALLSQLFSKGVASLSGEDAAASTNVSVLGGFGNNTGSSTISSNSSPNTPGASQWYNQNQNFNLKEAIAPFDSVSQTNLVNDPDCHFMYSSDLAGTIPSPQNTPTDTIMNPNALTNPACNKGYAVLQLAYAEALQAQTIKLQEALKWINYADYCLPGPRPDWYTSAVTAVNGLQERFSDISQEEDASDRAHHSYAELKYFTGFAADYADEGNLKNPSNAYNAILQTLSEKIGGWGYKQYIDDRYSTTNPAMPVIGPLIVQEYGRKNQYQNTISQNIAATAEARAMYLRLQNILANVQQGEVTYGVGTASEDTAGFKQFMDNQLKVFSRLVAQIKTIDDIENVISDTSLAEDEIKYLAHPANGIIHDCVVETTNAAGNASTLTNNMTRRPYGEAKATPTDFTRRGWVQRPGLPNADPLSYYTPAQSFLPDISISASGSGPTYIYVGHYVNSCSSNGLPPGNPDRRSPFDIRLGAGANYIDCADGDSDLTSTTGDRFEQHINSY